MFGDSFTYGHGIIKSGSRFSNILNSQLNRDPELSPCRYRIYNAGMGGTEPKDWEGYMSVLAPIFKPDLVIAVFFLRDGTNLCTSLACYKDQIRQLQAQYTGTFFSDHTYIGKYISNYLIRKNFSEMYVEGIRSAYLGSGNEKQEWLVQQRYLVRMKDTCHALGIDFRLLIFPILIGLEKNYAFHDVEAEISRFATGNDIPVYSLTPGFIGQTSELFWVSPNDQHPNEKGHQVAARTIFPYLKQVVLHHRRSAGDCR